MKVWSSILFLKEFLSFVSFVLLALMSFNLAIVQASAGPEVSSPIFQKKVKMYPGSGLTGTNGCSLTLIQVESKKIGPAYLLSAAHCIQYFHPKVLLYSGKFDGNEATVEVTPVNFYTLGPGLQIDLVIVKISETYADLKKLGVFPMKIDASPASVKDEIVLQGYMHSTDWFYMLQPEQLACAVDNFLEGVMYEKKILSGHNLRYGCPTHRGWSGSAIISQHTGKIIGVHSGGYTVNGPIPQPLLVCDNFPCDLSVKGDPIPLPLGDLHYGVSTLRIIGCFDENGEFDLARPLCGKMAL